MTDNAELTIRLLGDGWSAELTFARERVQEWMNQVVPHDFEHSCRLPGPEDVLAALARDPEFGREILFNPDMPLLPRQIERWLFLLREELD